MADPDPSSFLGLDGSNLAGTPSYLVKNENQGQGVRDESKSTVSNEEAPSFYSGNDWAFQDSPQFDSFNGVTSSAASESIFQTAPWELPPQQSQSPGLGRSDVSPSSLYTNPMIGSSAISKPGLPLIQTNPQALGLSPEALSTLTPAQQEKLRNIAMPPHLQYQSPRSDSSPGSPGSENKTGQASSPEHADAKTNSRKRKSSADVDDDDDDDDDGNQPVKKTAHNMIEKRYRTNLNDKIAALRDSVPSLRIMSKSARGEDTTEDREELHGLTPAHKLNKATVLSKATEYIRHLEKRNTRLLEENSVMQQRIAAFEKLFMAGAMGQTMNSMQQPPTPLQYPQDSQQFISTPIGTPRGGDASPPGLIQVPEDMKRILQAQMVANQPYPVPQQQYQPTPAMVRQQQIQHAHQMQQGRWQNGGPYFGKLMVGSLAGLMILEAVRENEQSNETPEGRGLFSLPLHLLSPLASGMKVNILGYHFSPSQVIYSLKMAVLFGTLLWVFVPSFFARKEPKATKTQQARSLLEAAPPPGSPIHVRQQAWLTAIQTVWVPQHNFFLEAAALMLKTMKLSLRNAIGVHGYQMLTGLTEEQETARVKAWGIALDAQLTGGDMEINKSRLTLTLLASGTLPDTPLRLMMKSLHVRILLWELGNSRMQLGVVNLIAAKLARSFWKEARQLNRLSKLQQGDELPEHLALLLEQECDNVLNDTVIQRAHNLSWNLATPPSDAGNTDGLDAVVDDPAVRSPMDAVAAWWSCQMLQRGLVESLSASFDDLEARSSITQTIASALKTAPVGSGAQARALVARAVLVEEKRGENLAPALQVVGPKPEIMSLVNRASPSPSPTATAATVDLQTALRCAWAIAHLQREQNTTPTHKTFQLINSIAGPATTANMSLLACTAAFRLMEHLFAHQAAAETFSNALERLAGSLRVWVGSTPGDESGLDQEIRHKMVDRCLSITKSVVGMETDTGYGSMSECEDMNGC